MKCIYCNDDTELTDSDIIPFALTGAKVHRKFVCHTHNAFTNDNFERTTIRRFDMYRNLLGLTERDGKPVRFCADLEIDGYKSKNVWISDKASIVGDTRRKYRAVNNDGHHVLLGEMNDLLKIKGATADKISQINLANISVSGWHNIRDLFISQEMLHTVAKIAYEWHCYINDIDGYIPEKYEDIVSYILTPDSHNELVELVVSTPVWALMDMFSRTGSNMLFEYQDVDGYTYIIFGFWNVILYKIRVCKSAAPNTELSNCYTFYLYHVDGTEDGHLYGWYGKNQIAAVKPDIGLSALCEMVKDRMSKLGERDLSLEYLRSCMKKIKKLLPKYEGGQCTLAELLDYEANDRVLPIYILEILLANKTEYSRDESFNQNMIRILKTDDRYVVTDEAKKAVLSRYMEMDKQGTFINLLNECIAFLDSI